jgi:hypothetical protein
MARQCEQSDSTAFDQLHSVRRVHASACPAQRPLLREELELRLLLEPRLRLLLLGLLLRPRRRGGDGERRPRGGLRRPRGGLRRPRGGLLARPGGERRRGGLRPPRGGLRRRGGLRPPRGGGLRPPRSGLRGRRRGDGDLQQKSRGGWRQQPQVSHTYSFLKVPAVCSVDENTAACCHSACTSKRTCGGAGSAGAGCGGGGWGPGAAGASARARRGRRRAAAAGGWAPSDWAPA